MRPIIKILLLLSLFASLLCQNNETIINVTNGTDVVVVANGSNGSQPQANNTQPQQGNLTWADLNLSDEEFPALGCVNQWYREQTQVGRNLCANYQNDIRNTLDGQADNCTLLYWSCCKNNVGEGENSTDINTCVKISKCQNFYAVTTCTTPNKCNKTQCDVQANSNLFVNNSNANDANVPHQVNNFIQQGDDVLSRIRKRLWIRSQVCAGEHVQDRQQADQSNCCTSCTANYYTLGGHLIFDYNLPELQANETQNVNITTNNNNSVTPAVIRERHIKDEIIPTILSARAAAILEHTIWNNKLKYWFEKCEDQRIEQNFGINKTNERVYYMLCKELAYDWGQHFAQYQCNPWYCNLQGQCQQNNSTNAATGQWTVAPTCQCNAGFKGKNCAYSDKDYDFNKRYITYLGDAIDEHVKEVKDDATFVALLRILQNAIAFASDAEQADKEQLQEIVGFIWDKVSTATYNYEDPLNLLLLRSFFENIVQGGQGIQGLDMKGLEYLFNNYPVLDQDLERFGAVTKQAQGNELQLGEQPHIVPGVPSNNNTPPEGGNITVIPAGGNVTIVPAEGNNITVQPNGTAEGNNTTVQPNTAEGNNVTVHTENQTIVVPPNETVTVTPNNTNNATVTVSGGGRRFLQDPPQPPEPEPVPGPTPQPNPQPEPQPQPLPPNNQPEPQPPTNQPQPQPPNNQPEPQPEQPPTPPVNNTPQPQPNNASAGQEKVKFNEEQKHPTATIPQDAIQHLNDTFISMIYLKNPRPFQQLNQPFINSQIVKIFAFKEGAIRGQDEPMNGGESAVQNATVINATNGTDVVVVAANNTNVTVNVTNATNQDIEYPQNATNMTIFIPWAYLPVRVDGNYKDQCKVYSFDGTDWANADHCAIDDRTNDQQAVISCNAFGTYGVGCHTQHIIDLATNNSPITVTATGDPVAFRVEVVHSSSSLLSVSALLIISLLGLIF